jgi:hypothetical protein
LTSLHFDMPAGIARFQLCATDPDIETEAEAATSTSVRNWQTSIFRRLGAILCGRKRDASPERRLLAREQLNKLEAVLGCKLTQIEARY